jgi:hypothetical protein
MTPDFGPLVVEKLLRRYPALDSELIAQVLAILDVWSAHRSKAKPRDMVEAFELAAELATRACDGLRAPVPVNEANPAIALVTGAAIAAALIPRVREVSLQEAALCLHAAVDVLREGEAASIAGAS